jgi:hypothetical protein
VRAAVTDFFPLRVFLSPFSTMTLSTATRCILCYVVFLLVIIRILRYVWRFAWGFCGLRDYNGDVEGYCYGLEVWLISEISFELCMYSSV